MAYQVPTVADITTNFPEMVGKEAQVTSWLNLAQPFFNYCRWDDLLFLGMMNWVCHMVTISNMNTSNSGKPFDDAVMKKVGDIAKSRDPRLLELQMKNTYMRTVYGQQYDMYKQLVGMGGVAV